MPIQIFSETEAVEILDFLRRRDPQIEILLQQRQSQSDALRSYALGLWTNGNPQAAAKVLNVAASLAPQDGAVWQDFAGALFADKQLDDAREAASAAISQNHNLAANYLLLAAIESQQGRDAQAADAYRQVLTLEPEKAEAAFGLGLLRAKERDYPEAARHLKTAVAGGLGSKGVQIALGQCLYLQGEFEEAYEAFSEAYAQDAHEPAVIEKLAVLELILEALGIDTPKTPAVSTRKIATSFGDLAGATRTAFHLLSGYGHYEAARRLGTERLRLAPDDKMQPYLNAALEGEALSRAPDDYLVAYFDGFAETFDRQLVEVLSYRAPQEIATRLKALGRTFTRILDLGCGTGLMGPLLKTQGAHLTGVDLSPGMLAQAQAKEVYDTLVKAEAVRFLEGATGPFDLVIAADLLIYIGDLEPLFAALERVLAPQAIVAFSIESFETSAGDETNYRLLPSGRFAHAEAYIERLAATHFAVVEKAPATLRIEANVGVEGVIFLLQRH